MFYSTVTSYFLHHFSEGCDPFHRPHGGRPREAAAPRHRRARRSRPNEHPKSRSKPHPDHQHAHRPLHSARRDIGTSMWPKLLSRNEMCSTAVMESDVWRGASAGEARASSGAGTPRAGITATAAPAAACPGPARRPPPPAPPTPPTPRPRPTCPWPTRPTISRSIGRTALECRTLHNYDPRLTIERELRPPPSPLFKTFRLWWEELTTLEETL